MLRYVKIHSRMLKDGQERSKRPSRALKKTLKDIQECTKTFKLIPEHSKRSSRTFKKTSNYLRRPKMLRYVKIHSRMLKDVQAHSGTFKKIFKNLQKDFQLFKTPKNAQIR
jgi:hypothetical protein